MANEDQELIAGLQREIELFEEIVAAKEAIINHQIKVIQHQESHINKLTELLDEVLELAKE